MSADIIKDAILKKLNEYVKQEIDEEIEKQVKVFEEYLKSKSYEYVAKILQAIDISMNHEPCGDNIVYTVKFDNLAKK